MVEVQGQYKDCQGQYPVKINARCTEILFGYPVYRVSDELHTGSLGKRHDTLRVAGGNLSDTDNADHKPDF